MTDVRFATPDDAGELVRLRELMFDDTDLPGGGFDDGWQESCEKLLLRELATGEHLVAAVIDAPDGSGRLASCGCMSFDARLPSPGNPSGILGWIGSMCTDRQWRRRGYAWAVLDLLLEEARRRKVVRVELNASDDGLELYRAAGFVERGGPPAMHWMPPAHVR